MDTTNNKDCNRTGSSVVGMESIDLSQNNQSDVTDVTDNNRPWLFKKGQSGNPEGRPKGSVSPITKLKQIFEQNPKEFEQFVDDYRTDPANRKHIVEMIDGKPKQVLAGDEENPLRIITVNPALAKKYGITSSDTTTNC